MLHFIIWRTKSDNNNLEVRKPFTESPDSDSFAVKEGGGYQLNHALHSQFASVVESEAKLKQVTKSVYEFRMIFLNQQENITGTRASTCQSQGPLLVYKIRI